jgi:hypothetical protein
MLAITTIWLLLQAAAVAAVVAGMRLMHNNKNTSQLSTDTP